MTDNWFSGDYSGGVVSRFLLILKLKLMKSVNGLVKPLNPDVEVNYEGHTLVVSYRLSGELNDFFSIPERATIELPKDGNFIFEIPNEEDITGKILVSVKGPISEIFSQEYDYSELNATVLSGTKTKNKSALLLEINVDPQFQVIILDNDNVPQYKVRGRLINFNDGLAISQRTLFVHLHYKSEDEMKPAAEIPVFAMLKTDSSGYFSFDAPGQPLHKGFVKIAGLSNDIFALEADPANDEQLDKNQIIVIDGDILPVEDHEDDCSCHGDPDSSQMPDAEDLVVSGAYSNLKGKNCVDFTKPNRSLEEFSYVKIVRTTEPDFKKVPYRKPPLLKIPTGPAVTHIQSHENVSYEPEGGSNGAKKDGGMVDAPQNNTDGNNTGTQQDAPKEPDLRAFYLYVQNSWAANSKYWVFSERVFELIDLTQLWFTPAPDSYKDYNPVEKWLDTLAELFEYVYEKTHKTESELYAFLQFINNRFKTENRRKCANPEEMEDFVRTFFQEGSHGRIDVDGNHGIDWDDSPTLYQNTSIAHGHIIHIKQIWRADGYSMGDLLYSLPLAPCQKKQIAIFDWGRSESAGRSESLTAEDHLTAHLSRDRDVTDIINTSLSESIKGGSESELYSKSKTSGIGGGIGGAFGGSVSASMPPEATAAATGIPANVSGAASLGVSGGLAGGFGKQVNESNANASAWQDSARDLSASSMNNLKDSIMQSASSIRSQRSTVIETISQNETMNVQTEVIANHNHCHSMTMEYFEVLRHFAIEQKVADVQECLFIPLEMSAFNAEKILRWKDELYRALPAQGLKEGIVALEDIKRKYKFADPNEILADEAVQEIYGEVVISLNINRPKDPDPVQPTEGDAENPFHGFDEQEWQHLLPFLGAWNTSKIKSAFEREVQKKRDEIWSKEILPEILANFLDQLEIDAYDSNNKPLNLDLEMSVEPNTRMKYSRLKGKRALKKSRKIAILKNYNPGHELKLILRMFPSDANVSRSKIHDIQIKNNFDLPEGSKAVFFGGFMRYKTDSLNETLFSISKRHDEFTEDGSSIFTPLNQRELFNPVKEAYKTANRLIEHINDHLEHYHKVIWYQMDSDKRYMMLDGFTAPNADGRSVASVIENRLIDIVGNNLVMPVAKGVRIDPTFKQLVEGESESEEATKPIDLLKHYSPNTPVPPFRVSVPTRGVYAEAVMGNCNSCEKIDESRHWRFTEVPCGDEPTAIGTISTDSRRAAPSDLTAKDLSTPIINIQNAPDAPDPQGFAGALEALTASNAFNNLTGLDQTQLNALEALKAASAGSSAAMQGSMDSAQAYAQMAKDLAMHASSIKNSAKTADAIDNALNAGKISNEEAKKLHLDNLKSRIPNASGQQIESNSNNALIPDNPGQFESFEASDGDGSVKFTTPHGGYGLSADTPIEDQINNALEIFAEENDIEVDQWIKDRTKIPLKLRDSTSYDDSYMKSGVRVLWKNPSGGDARFILDPRVAHSSIGNKTGVAEFTADELYAYPNTFNVQITVGNIYSLNSDDGILWGIGPDTNLDSGAHQFKYTLEVNKQQIDGWNKGVISLREDYPSSSKLKSLFNNWSSPSYPVAGPYKSAIDAFVFPDDNQQILVIRSTIFSEEVTTNNQGSTTSIETSTTSYKIGSYFGADVNNQTTLKFKMTGSDLVEIIAPDGKDKPSVSGQLSNQLVLKSLRANSEVALIEKLLDGLEVELKLDIEQALKIFAEFSNKSTNYFIEQDIKTTFMEGVYKYEHSESCSIIIKDTPAPTEGMRIVFYVTSFQTGVHQLTPDQEASLEEQWAQQPEHIRNRILSGHTGVKEIVPFGSASNLDGPGPNGDDKNEALAINRAQAVLNHVFGPSILGGSVNPQVLNDLTSPEEEKHWYPQIDDNDNQRRFRYAKVTIELK